MQFWGRSLLTFMLVCAVALATWPLLGATGALAALSALLLLLIAHHLRNLSRLLRWIQNPAIESAPEASGVWGDVFSYAVRILRRQRHSESRLSAALQRFQLAGAALPEAVVLLDADDRIEWCNPRAESYFGLELDRDRGQQVTYILRQPQLAEYLSQPMVTEPLVLRLSDVMRELVVSIQLVPYGSSQKLLLGRNITRWERLEVTRRDFVANVSHELRTPLTVVRGFLETLGDIGDTDPELTKRSVQLMTQQTARMERLVEDLLTLSRLESTQHAPHREENVNVPELAKLLTQEANALSAGRHRIRLHIDCADWLRGSSDELRTAFGNLVSNAVRYTPEGGKIELRWARAADRLAFSVRDSGIGIEPQHINRLTERFYRVDKSRSRSQGGTGLGLSIVKHILSAHGEKLQVSSTEGKGSTFGFALDAAPTDADDREVHDRHTPA